MTLADEAATNEEAAEKVEDEKDDVEEEEKFEEEDEEGEEDAENDDEEDDDEKDAKDCGCEEEEPPALKYSRKRTALISRHTKPMAIFRRNKKKK